MVAFARQYDDAARMTQMVSGGPDGVVGTGSDQATLYTYTKHGQIATTVYPDATPNTVTNTWYARNDALDTVTDQKGVVTKHEYKAVAAGSDYNVESRQYVSTSGSTPDGGDQEEVATADGLGRVASVVTNNTHASGTQTSKVTNAYKFCGALWKQSQQLGDGSGDVRTVEYRFDTCGKPDRLYWPYTSSSGDYVAYSDFDGLNRPLTIANNIDGDATTIVTYKFLGQRPAEKEYPQETGSYTVRQTFWSASENNYDSYGRLARSHAVRNPGGTPAAELLDLRYQFDAAGNPTWRYDVLQNSGATKWSQTYEHDVRNQLTHAIQGAMDGTWPSAPAIGTADKTWTWDDGTTYSLDKMGNWAKFYNNAVVDERTHNGVNEVETINSSSAHVSHDADGNMNKVPKPADPFNHHYACTYDFRNRLVKVETDDVTPAKVAEYSYDGLGRRIRKIVYDTNGTTVVSDTRYVYDNDWRVIEEQKADDSYKLVARYIYGGLYIDEPVRMYRDGNDDGAFDNVADVNVYYLQDRVFNVVALTDAEGAVQERTWYECYGKPTNRRASDDNETTASHFGNPYLFTGRELDSETGLYNYRARYYGAELGRFVSRDPISYYDGFNLYEYVGENPVDKVDPYGQKSCCCCVNRLSFSAAEELDPEKMGVGQALTTVNTAGRFGHRFKVFIDRLFKESDKNSNCSLEWYEWSDNFPAESAYQHCRNGRWCKLTKEFMKSAGYLPYRHPKPFNGPGRPPVAFVWDFPSLAVTSTTPHTSREMYFAVRVKSSCPASLCEHRELTRCAVQHLKWLGIGSESTRDFAPVPCQSIGGGPPSSAEDFQLELNDVALQAPPKFPKFLTGKWWQ